MEKSIFHALMRQHRMIEDAFDQIEADLGRKPAHAALRFISLRRDLLAHARAEQAVVYPRFREIPDLARDIRIAVDEHADVEKRLAELGRLDVNDVEFAARLAELKAAVLGHAAEEEGEIFRIAKLELESDESEELAMLFLEEYQRLELPSRNVSPETEPSRSPSYRRM